MPKTRLASPSHPVWRRFSWGGDDDDLGFGGVGSDLAAAADEHRGYGGCGSGGSAASEARYGGCAGGGSAASEAQAVDGPSGGGEEREREEREREEREREERERSSADLPALGMSPLLPEWSLAPTDVNHAGSPLPSAARSSTWENSYAELVEYIKYNGNARVPRKYSENPRLGHWVRNQRSFYRQNKMKEDRIRRLVAVGFCFDVRSANRTAPAPDADIDASRDRTDDAAVITSARMTAASSIAVSPAAPPRSVVPPPNDEANGGTTNANGGATAATDAHDAAEEGLALLPRFDAERIVKRVSTAGRKHYYCRVMGCMKEPQGACGDLCRKHFTTLGSQIENTGIIPPPRKNKRRCKVEGCNKDCQGVSKEMCLSHFKGGAGTPCISRSAAMQTSTNALGGAGIDTLSTPLPRV